MYPTLALQAAAVGVALLLTASNPSAERARHEPQQAVHAASAEPARMHCRLYFGCAPAPIASAQP